ncbi:antitoxin VapB family protein [Natrialbaceae archaeon A-arb3/5]
MGTEITISDDVYRRLERETGDRNFSEVIDEMLDERRQLADVVGQGVLSDETS